MWLVVQRALGIIGGLIVLLVTVLHVRGTTGTILGFLGAAGGIALIAWLVLRILRKPSRGGGFWIRARIDTGFGRPPR